ncbi:MAG: tRNA (guanosine(46)-N7)-methyltransferase TrmB [Synergistaceae bacterium]|nr:tRNA (guanosine(46)-N7)-methyltransferase TrmB [Synergistaceae bacterium]
MHWNFTNIILRPGGAKLGPGYLGLALEIGFGNGEYLQHLADSGRYDLAVGIEVSQWCITKAARRALANGTRNIRLMCGDARHLLKYTFEKESVRDVFMNFPCPWPKRRHADRRVARSDFAKMLALYIMPGGAFTLATDVPWYADDAREVFASSPHFAAGRVIRNPDRDCVTKYERKWKAMSRDTFQLRAEKTGHCAGTEAQTGTEDDGMTCDAESASNPNINFRAKVASLQEDAVTGIDYRAMFREIFWRGENEALVLVISADEGFEQHYYLRITENNGRYNVRTDSVGHPYKTPAVRASVKHVMQRLSGV